MYGERIKEYLTEKGIKQNYVASETKIAENSLSAMLNGKRKITVEEYFSICKVLGVQADFFTPNQQAS